MLTAIGARPAVSKLRFGKLNSVQENIAKALGADPSQIADEKALKKTFMDNVVKSFKDYKETGKYRTTGEFLDLSAAIEALEHLLKKTILPLGQKLGKFNVQFKDTDRLDTFKDTLSVEDQQKVFQFLEQELPQALGVSDGGQLTDEVMKEVEAAVTNTQKD